MAVLAKSGSSIEASLVTGRAAPNSFLILTVVRLDRKQKTPKQASIERGVFCPEKAMPITPQQLLPILSIANAKAEDFTRPKRDRVTISNRMLPLASV